MDVSVSGNKTIITSSYGGTFRLERYPSYPKDIDAIDGYGVEIYGDNRNNKIWLGRGLPEVYGGKGNDTLYAGLGAHRNDFHFYRGDGYDTIVHFSANDVIHLNSGSLQKAWLCGNDVVLQLDTGGILLKDARGVQVKIEDAAGKTTTTVYDTGNTPSGKIPAAFGSSSSGTDGKNGKVVLGKDVKGTFDLSRYKDSKAKDIDASANERSLTIKGDSRNNLIYSSEGGCKVYGYKGNDTLYGGSDSDIFYYGTGDGKDTIRNFQSGDDLVRFYKGSVTSFKSSGKNVVLGTSGQGSITLAAMAGKRIDVMDAKGAKTAYWVGKQTTANKLTGADTASVLVGGAKKDILKAGKGNSKLYGQDGNDTLTGGAGKDYLDGGKGNDSLFGGSGNDTLFGGAGNDILRGGRGNDTLNGGAGRDIFLYANGDGKDVIETYTDAQAIKILSGRISSMKASKKHYHSDKGYVQDVVLTIGNGSVTLKDVSPQSSFNVIYASGNTKSYTVSSLKTK